MVASPMHRVTVFYTDWHKSRDKLLLDFDVEYMAELAEPSNMKKHVDATL